MVVVSRRLELICGGCVEKSVEESVAEVKRLVWTSVQEIGGGLIVCSRSIDNVARLSAATILVQQVCMLPVGSRIRLSSLLHPSLRPRLPPPPPKTPPNVSLSPLVLRSPLPSRHRPPRWPDIGAKLWYALDRRAPLRPTGVFPPPRRRRPSLTLDKMSDPTTSTSAPPPSTAASSGESLKRRAEDDGYHKPKRVMTEEDALNASSSDDRSSRGHGRGGGRGGRGKPYGQRGGGYKGKGPNRAERMRERGRERGRFPSKPVLNEEDAMNAEGAATPASTASAAEGKEATEGEEGEEGAVKEKRLPKKRAAVLVGYCGTGYHGMQM